MNGSLEGPKLERTTVTAPKPVTLENADTVIPKNKRNKVVDFGEDMVKAMGLLTAKIELDGQIRELGNAGGNEKELADLEDNRRGIINVLAELRPAEFADEAAFENYLSNTSSKEKNTAIKAKETAKNDLEEQYDQLQSKIRLAKIPGSEFASQLSSLKAELKSCNELRLKSWAELAELDPKQYRKDYMEELEMQELLDRDENKKKLEDIIARTSTPKFKPGVVSRTFPKPTE